MAKLLCPSIPQALPAQNPYSTALGLQVPAFVPDTKQANTNNNGCPISPISAAPRNPIVAIIILPA